MNAINSNNRKDDIKKEDDEIVDVDQFILLMNIRIQLTIILKSRLRAGDLHQQNLIIKNDIELDDGFFNFKTPIKNLSDVDKIIHRIIYNFKPKIETQYKDKKVLLPF